MTHIEDILFRIIMVALAVFLITLMVASCITNIDHMELSPSKIVYETSKEDLLSKRVVLGYAKNNPNTIVVKLEQEEAEVIDLDKKTGMSIEYGYVQGEVVQLNDKPTLEQINQVRDLLDEYIQLANDNTKLRANQEQILDVILEEESEEPVQEEVEQEEVIEDSEEVVEETSESFEQFIGNEEQEEQEEQKEAVEQETKKEAPSIVEIIAVICLILVFNVGFAVLIQSL